MVIKQETTCDDVNSQLSVVRESASLQLVVRPINTGSISLIICRVSCALINFDNFDRMLAPGNLLLSRPQWVINNQLTMPLITIADGSNKKSVRGIVAVAVPFTIFLDTMFNQKKFNKRYSRLSTVYI